MTDEELKALVAANAQAIAIGIQERKEWRDALKAENAEWKAGIEDTIALVAQGQTELGEKLDAIAEELGGMKKILSDMFPKQPR